jgi:tetratricopeptide (TPR) repeat protein
MQLSDASCYVCGRPIRTGAHFCGACGAALNPATGDQGISAARLAALSPLRPAALPSISGFVGRAAELDYFRQKLATAHLAVITGLSGMGKTALAATLAQQVADTKCIFWHAFRKHEGVDVITWELAAFLAWHGHKDLWLMLQGARQAGGQLPPPTVLLDYLVQAIGGRGYVLCFDDFQFVEDDPLLDQLVSRVRAELQSGAVDLIVTSRHVPTFTDTTAFEPLNGLSVKDARDLLAAHAIKLPGRLSAQLTELTSGNAQLLLLAIDALRRARDLQQLIAQLLETENIERYLLREVDAGLTDDLRAVMSALAVLLGFPASRAAITAVLGAEEGGQLLRADAYTAYENALERLMSQLDTHNSSHADALIYQQRLTENIAQARRYGDTETRRAERAELVDRLNQLSLDIIGQPFTKPGGPSAPLHGLEQVAHVRDLRRTLSELSNRNLLNVSEGEAGREYTQHAIVQSFYYGLLGQRERAALHLRAGNYYETEERKALLAARHFAQIGQHSHAARLATADIWAMINQGQAQSLRLLLEQFTAHQMDADQWVEVLLARGEIYARLSQSRQAKASYAQALAQLAGSPDTAVTHERKARACRGMGHLLKLEAPREALEWLQRGLNELAGSGGMEEALLYVTIGAVLITAGEYTAALGALAQSLQLLPDDASHWRATAMMNLGLVHYYRGDTQEAKEYNLRALAICQETHNDWRSVTIRTNLALVIERAGDWGSALVEYREALEVTQRLGNLTDQALLALNLGNLQNKQGDTASAKAQLEQCLRLALEHNLVEYIVAGQSSLADLAVRDADWDAAERQLQAVEPLAQASDTKFALPEIYRGWAQLYLARGQALAALEHAERALEVARELEDPLEQGMCLRVLGQAELAAQRPDRAVVAFEQSLALLDRADAYEAARTRVQLAIARRSYEAAGEADALLREARATFQELGAQRDMSAADEILRGYQ